MFSFFRDQYRNARTDPFFPAGRVAAVVFVVVNWGWLRRNDAADWPLPPVA